MSRYNDDVEYPKLAMVEMAAIFFGANFCYHKAVYRTNLKKLNFFSFLFINALASYNITEATNASVARYYAAAYNNTVEMEHRAKLSYIMRKKIYGGSF